MDEKKNATKTVETKKAVEKKTDTNAVEKKKSSAKKTNKPKKKVFILTFYDKVKVKNAPIENSDIFGWLVTKASCKDIFGDFTMKHPKISSIFKSDKDKIEKVKGLQASVNIKSSGASEFIIFESKKEAIAAFDDPDTILLRAGKDYAIIEERVLGDIYVAEEALNVYKLIKGEWEDILELSRF